MDHELQTNKRPQVLLLGNGINLGFSDNGISWPMLLEKITTNKSTGELLDELTEKSKENGTGLSAIPFPLEIVLRTDDNVDTTMNRVKTDEDIKELMYGSVNKELKDILQKILSMNFDHILTTNYSYELEMSVTGDSIGSIDKTLKRTQKHTDAVSRAESKFLLHTYYPLEFNGIHNRVWHIHGEARKPNSMIIGHYYYGSLLSKYKEFLDKQSKIYNSMNKDKTTFNIKSWLDAFIFGDVYIVGLGLDFSEMDLWWLINRKKREKSEHGKIIYYDPKPYGTDTDDKLTAVKHKLLTIYDAEVRSPDCGYEKDNKTNYKLFYKNVLTDIGRTMSKHP